MNDDPHGLGSPGADGPEHGRPAHRPRPGLTRRETVLAGLAFGLWLVAFAGGILLQTRPSRALISPGGVAALEGIPIDSVYALYPHTRPDAAGARAVPLGAYVKAWAVVLVWFLPLNLALLCALAGSLGAFGARANLQGDGADAPPGPSADLSSPYVSALLRGFFVYLVMISGLLLLDDDPFGSPSPGQYIRLAGFLSLFSFVVSYNPGVFSGLLAWASTRVASRGGAGGTTAAAVQVDTREVKVTQTQVHAARVQTTTETAPVLPAGDGAPAAPAPGPARPAP